MSKTKAANSKVLEQSKKVKAAVTARDKVRAGFNKANTTYKKAHAKVTAQYKGVCKLKKELDKANNQVKKLSSKPARKVKSKPAAQVITGTGSSVGGTGQE